MNIYSADRDVMIARLDAVQPDWFIVHADEAAVKETLGAVSKCALLYDDHYEEVLERLRLRVFASLLAQHHTMERAYLHIDKPPLPEVWVAQVGNAFWISKSAEYPDTLCCAPLEADGSFNPEEACEVGWDTIGEEDTMRCKLVQRVLKLLMGDFE